MQKTTNENATCENNAGVNFEQPFNHLIEIYEPTPEQYKSLMDGNKSDKDNNINIIVLIRNPSTEQIDALKDTFHAYNMYHKNKC